ncbi:hypothetical protein B0H11DRAFT_655764 [Mycena galericulata]|nr:hypothetical protein B0H11DRAFT_655764 [Mycena galericulata]
MANVPYGISPRVFYAVALSFFVTSILHLATNAAIARLNMPRIFRVPRALICNVLLFVAFFVPALPLFFQDNRHQEDAPPFLASNQSAPLFWMLTGAVFFVFLHIGPAAPRARIAEPLPRSPLDIPPFGIFWSLIVFFVFDVLRFSASVIHENSFQYGWARSFKMWLHPFRNVHNATIWYSRRTILPYSIQALFRPVVKYLTGIEDLPEWLPQPPVGRIQFICEVILLSAVSLPDLAALVKPILRRSPRLAALSTVLDRAIFSPVNPQALEQRRYAWASLFWLSWIYVALGTVQALPALACVIKLFGAQYHALFSAFLRFLIPRFNSLLSASNAYRVHHDVLHVPRSLSSILARGAGQPPTASAELEGVDPFPTEFCA